MSLYGIALLALHLSLPPAARPDVATVPAPRPAAEAPGWAMRGDARTAKIRARISAALPLLKAKKYSRFFADFSDPVYLEEKGIDAMMEHLEPADPKLLMALLKEARRSEPVYSPDGAIASFTIAKPAARGWIDFILVDGIWYMKDYGRGRASEL